VTKKLIVREVSRKIRGRAWRGILEERKGGGELGESLDPKKKGRRCKYH